MPALRDDAAFRVACFAAVLAASACDQSRDDPELALAQQQLQTADAGGPDQAAGSTADHASFAVGTVASTLELGGLRVVRDVCDAADQACVLKAGRPQVFVASLDARGRARWLLAPLQAAAESRLFATHERADRLFVLASYQGTPALHPRLGVSTAQQLGLILFQLDRRGNLVQAHKLAESAGYDQVSLAAEPAGALRVNVGFQGRLDLSDRSFAAGSGGARATLVFDPDVSSLAVELDFAPQQTNCSDADLALLCNVGIKPKPGCNGGVCSKDPFCCNNTWDKLCITEATERVADCDCTHAFDKTGLRLARSCDHSDPGHDCPSLVCGAAIGDPYCCDNFWDAICVGHISQVGACND